MTTEQLTALVKKVERQSTKRNTYVEKLAANYRTRFCIFDHPDKKNDPDAFPWQGASDQKVFFVDKEIRKKKALLVNAVFKARTMFEPLNMAAMQKAKLAEEFWHWMFHIKMQPRREVQLLADIQEEKGLAIANVVWEMERSEVMESIDREQFPPEFQQAVLDPNVLEEQLVPQVKVFYPEATNKEIIEAIQLIRSGKPLEEVKLRKVIYGKQQPRIVALTPDTDVILPVNTTDIQSADWIIRVHYYSKPQLQQDIYSLGYDKAVAERLIETMFDEDGVVKGSAASGSIGTSNANITAQQDNEYGITRVGMEGLMIWDFYERVYDDKGVCKINVTTFCPCDCSCGELRSEPLGYDHGKYPFVAFEREVIGRNIHASRGVPEFFRAIQEELKVQLDSSIDRTTMATLPPLCHPQGIQPNELGPGAMYGYQQSAKEVSWMDVPQNDMGANQVSSTLRAEAEEYTGNISAGASFTGSITPKSSAEAKQVGAGASMVIEFDLENWMNGWQEVDSQCWSLIQQNLKEEVWFRALGDPNAPPVRVSAQDIMGEYDLYPTLSIHDLMPQQAIEMSKQILQAALQDRSGSLDIYEAFNLWLTRMDVRSSRRVLRPPQVSQQVETDAELAAISKIYAGIPVNVEPNANVQIRFGVLQQYLQQPDIQQRLKADEAFRTRMETRVEQYKFLEQQAVNAQTGRIGAQQQGALGAA